jgi:hypothetical protein
MIRRPSYNDVRRISSDGEAFLYVYEGNNVRRGRVFLRYKKTILSCLNDEVKDMSMVVLTCFMPDLDLVPMAQVKKL